MPSGPGAHLRRFLVRKQDTRSQTESTWSSWEPPDGDFSVSYSYGNGTDLLTSNSVSRGNALKLNPWDLAIVEDQ